MFITIDSASTKDFDDALSCERRGTGYRIRVAIADPSDAIPQNSDMDLKAREKVATQYVRDTAAVPMLPRKLSEEECSLIAGQSRSALVFNLDLDDTLELTSLTLKAESITVCHRLTYSEIEGLIREDEHSAVPTLALASRISHGLLHRRRQQGALALFDLNRGLLTDEDGNLKYYSQPGAISGHLIVQEMMILLNASVAQYMAKHDVPAIYRNHQASVSAPKAFDMANSLESWLAAVYCSATTTNNLPCKNPVLGSRSDNGPRRWLDMQGGYCKIHGG